jgi:hypothetical protein
LSPADFALPLAEFGPVALPLPALALTIAGKAGDTAAGGSCGAIGDDGVGWLSWPCRMTGAADFPLPLAEFGLEAPLGLIVTVAPPPPPPVAQTVTLARRYE